MSTRALILAAISMMAIAQRVFSDGDSPPLPLTLQAAVSQARSNRLLVGRAEAEMAAARSRVGEALSGYYPSIGAQAGYLRVEPDQSFTFPGLGTFSLGQVDNWDLHLGLDQVLYAFGRREYQVGIARTGLRSAEIELDQNGRAVGFKTARVFYALLFLKQELDSLDGQLADLNEHLALVRKKAATGSATNFEVLSTKVEVTALESERLQTAGDYAKQRLALAALVGLDPSRDIEPSGDFRAESPPDDGAALVASAFAKRPELQLAGENEASAKLALALAGAESLPTLRARAEAGYKNGLLPDEGKLSFAWNLGLSLDLPLFEGFLLADKRDEALAHLRTVSLEGASLRTGIETEVLQAYRDLLTCRAAEANAATRLDEASSALAAGKLQFDLGALTNVEYLNSQTALEKAKLAHLQTLYLEACSDLALREATGEEPY